MHDPERYWAYRWLDEYGIKQPDDAFRVLTDDRAVERIRELASKVPTPARSVENDDQIVAGWGLDISAWRGCTHLHCRRSKVENLLRHTWHYFDGVIVEDALRHEVMHHWHEQAAVKRRWLGAHVTALLHVRTLGAEPFVRFMPKVNACAVHWREHAIEDGLAELVSHADELIARTTAEATIERVGGEVIVRHSSLPGGHLRRSNIAPDATTEDVKKLLEEHFASYVSYTRTDVLAARAYDASLGIANQTVSALFGHRPTSVSDVLFELRLPVLLNIPVQDLIAIRKDYTDEFRRFQVAVRRAALAVVKEHPTTEASALAKRIQRDVIEPEIETIRVTLKSARRLIARKSALAAALGAVATGCGLLVGSPAATAAGFAIGAIAAALNTGGAKYLETRDEVSRSDMFFVWKAAEGAEDHHR